MQFHSILFDQNRVAEYSHFLDFYTDLNLDQIIETTISYKKEFDIKKFFYMPLSEKKSIIYRQDIVKDLQKEKFYIIVDEFANKLLDIKKQQDMIKNLEYEEFEKRLVFADGDCVL